jgi:hypothetical protein
VFCPNCGTQNPDAAQTCSKCNFHLKSVAAPKFKGTMLMMNQASIPGAPAPGAAPAARPGGPTGSAPPPGAPSPAISSKLKGTMVGVAPMAGPSRGMPGGAPPPATPLPPAPPYGMGPELASSFSPPVPQPGVNPLGGTVAADGSSFAAAFPPPGGSPYGGPQAPIPQGTAMMPGGMAPPYAPYGAPPQGPQHGSGNPPPYDAGPYGSPSNNPYGASPAPNPFAGPPQGYAPAGGYGTPPQAYGAPPAAAGQAMAPYNAQSVGLAGPMMGQPLATAGARPQRRNALMTFLMPLGVVVVGAILSSVLAMVFRPLGMLGSLVALAGLGLFVISAITMVNELKSVTRNDAFAWWPMFVPFYGIYWACILVPQEVGKAKQLLGVQEPPRSLVLYLFLFHFAFASDINDLAR